MDKPPHDPVNYELRPGDLEGNYAHFLDTLTDVPESPSLQPLNIDEAGITNQQVYIQLQDIEGKGIIKTLLCDIQIGATLHGHRGIHMSRCEEALFEVSKDVHPSIDHYAVALARAVRDKQGGQGSVVQVNGVYLHTHMTNVTKRESHDKMYLLSEAIIDGDHERVSTGVRTYNITACPCTRTYTKYSVVPALLEKGFSLEQIQEILNITLTGTHTQRGTISVVIDKTHEDITTGELYMILDRSAHLVFELLKRPDEHDLVVRALKRPQFTEDVARETAVNTYRRFGQVAPGKTHLFPLLPMEHEQYYIEEKSPETRMGTLPIAVQKTAQMVRQVIQPLEAGSKEHNIYVLEGFRPIMINEAYLRSISIDTPIAQTTAEQLKKGSEKFQRLYENRNLTPDQYFSTADIPLHDPLEIHNYTGMCPTFVYELTPSKGACSIACQYCLVTDGDHCQPTVVWSNYAEYIGRILEERRNESAFYYFSPKTEAFSEPHLQTGIAHGILRTFIGHFDKHPDSKARMFMATKAGPKHLLYQHKGDSILDLLHKLAGKIQVNGSIGIMPTALRDVLEPNAASIDDRLTALQMCQREGILAESVLAQPLLLPYMREEVLLDYFQRLHAADIRNIKPEFLTVDVGNLVALAQFVHHFNPDLMKELLEVYVHPENQDHVKQRSRLAPDRKSSIQMLKKLQEYATKFGISISICNWVKKQLIPLEPSLATIDCSSKEHGYRCLGYQTQLLDELATSKNKRKN